MVGGMADLAGTIIPLYERNAQGWDAIRPRALVERPWLDRFLALVPAGSRVLDLGCGCGEPIAAHLAGQGFAVTGVDSSAAMVALCRGRMPGQDWVVADMRGLRLGSRFAGILAWDSFFHLSPDDQRGMFPVFRDHAAPGAALMFTSGPRAGEAIGTMFGEPLYHASLDGAEYRALLRDNGFRVRGHVVEDPACGGRTIWLAQAG